MGGEEVGKGTEVRIRCEEREAVKAWSENENEWGHLWD